MRWAWFAIGLAASALLTLWLWSIGFPGFFLFLLFPFFAFALPRGARTCARCGWSTRDPASRFCPRDGTPLA